MFREWGRWFTFAAVIASAGFGDARADDRPEFKNKTFVTGLGKEFQYRDATMSEGGSSSIGVEPLDEINQWLTDKNFKCLNLSQVELANGPQGTAHAKAGMQTIGHKRFVIVCDGDCKGLRYSITGRLARGPTFNKVWHFGMTQPYPTFHIQAAMLTKSSIAFEFQTDVPHAKADVRVFQWSAQFGDYGDGCKIF